MSDPVAEAAAQIAAQEQEDGTAMAGESMTNVQTAETTQTSATAASTEKVDLPNAGATSPATASESGISAASSSGDLPNVASVAEDPTVDPVSAPSAAGANTTLPTAESSVEPPHVRIASHLEAIYLIAKDIPHVMVADTGALKTHVGDILHRISNGMAVTEGELVSKLEALYHKL